MLIAHITDTHITLPGALAYGKVDTAALLRRCVDELLALEPAPELIVHTGDLVDRGAADEYAHLRAIVAPLKAPLLAIPGNHDERAAMRAAFAAEGYLPHQGHLQFTLEYGGLRIVGLDTLVPGQGGGELCGDRLAWLEGALSAAPRLPTLVLMHHPPFATGIAHMDRIGLRGVEGFAAIMRRHEEVEAVLCGHVHRTIHARVGGRAAMIGPSPAHQVVLDLRPTGPSAFRLEPPGYMLHHWHDGELVSYAAVTGDWPGPYPFFDAAGKLL